jgi:hypothetical protein
MDYFFVVPNSISGIQHLKPKNIKKNLTTISMDFWLEILEELE